MRLLTAPAFLIATLSCGIGGLFAQVPPSDASGEPGTVARITETMRANLERLPNYTCTETIERTRRAPGGGIALADTLRLEVAIVNGQEIFAWPGSTEFQDTELRNLIQNGSYGSGAFGLYAEMLFFAGGPQLEPRGLEELDGQSVLKFDFRMPRSRSQYRVTVDRRTALVGYSGSVYADAKTFDLRRLEIRTEEIPPELGLKASEDRVDYQRLGIGEDNFLLPVQNRLTMETGDTVNENFVRFTGCRKFTGESELVFVDPEFTDAAAVPQVREVSIPPQTALQFVIKGEIDLATAAVGDPIQATLNRRVRVDGEELAPKGAIATGRIIRLDRTPGYYSLAFYLTDLSWPSGHASIAGTFERVPFPAAPRTAPFVPEQSDGFIIERKRTGSVRIPELLFVWRIAK